MLGVGTRVRVRADQGCHYQHGRDVNGQIGTIVAVVTDEMLASARAPLSETRNRLTIESFAGHVYSVELNEPGGLDIELCAASELRPVPTEAR